MDNNDESQEPVDGRPGSTIEPLKFEPLGDKPPAKTFTIRRRAALVAFSLLICAAAAAFLFTARAVYVEATPAWAEVTIDSVIKLKLADRYLLMGGEHSVSLLAEGYYPLTQTIDVGEEQDQHFEFTLERLPGHLQVNTDPVTGADIFIDDVLVGSTPSLVRGIAPGSRRLRITAERYFPFEQDMEIEGLDKEQAFQTELVPAWAEVRLASDPAGADIFVDEILLGQTPLDTEILEGKHSIRIKLAGHKPWQDEVTVIANQAMDISDVILQPADAIVFLASEPPRANATVDGEYKGLTPLELALTPEKTTTIRLFKQGYKSVNRSIRVGSGEEKRLVINLPPELVEVKFNITPADARLYVNGKVQSVANQTIRLPARSHRIEVRKEGYVEYKTKITPHTGIPQQVNVNLKSERQAKLEKIKPIYTSNAGQTLKLFYPGPFTMGASRREPGRRANETIRNISLKRPFYISLHEVTNIQFKKFATSHVSGVVQGRSLDGDHQPVANVTWEQAARFCNWLSNAESLTPFYTEKDNKIVGFNIAANGYRLPTEAEWAWSARVRGREKPLKFPWGDKMPPPEKSGNFADNSTTGFLGKTIAGYNDGYLGSAEVGRFPANTKGLFDLGGNVAEWVNDFYDIQLGSADKPEVDPMGPETGKFHVIRGSSWAHGTVTELRLSYRDYNAKARDDVGFRIARYLE